MLFSNEMDSILPIDTSAREAEDELAVLEALNAKIEAIAEKIKVEPVPNTGADLYRERPVIEAEIQINIGQGVSGYDTREL